MGFNNAAAAPAETPANQSWKAKGFFNFYLPTANGTRRKLGAIPLKDSINSQKLLLDWLNEDPDKLEERLKKIMNKLEVEYQPAESAEGSAFDLG